MFSKTIYENIFSRNDVHQISRERNQHIEAFQDVDRDNVSLREELRKYNAKLEKLFKHKVSFPIYNTKILFFMYYLFLQY